METFATPWMRITGITWELIRNAETWALPQTYQIRICILTRSPGDWGYSYKHESLRSPAVKEEKAIKLGRLLRLLCYFRFKF